jgi:hypothetical protein
VLQRIRYLVSRLISGGSESHSARPWSAATRTVPNPEILAGFRPIRNERAGVTRERVVFLNSIGGLGDALPIPLLARWYKKYYPQDTTILYDSLFIGHYFEPFSGVDEVIRANEHMHDYRLPQQILQADPLLPRNGGIALQDTEFTRLASTHHAHRRWFKPQEVLVKLDFITALTEIVRDDFRSFDITLRAEHRANVDRIVNELSADGRVLFGMQTRGACPYEGLMVPRAKYVRDLTVIAEELADRYGARVLICGDDELRSKRRYARGDWVALDRLVPNIYYKLDIMRRTRLYLGAGSGFSIVVNLMRSPEQVPAIPIYTNPETLLGKTYTYLYPTYVEDGGRTDCVDIFAFRHPDLRDFLFDSPHTPDKVLAMVARFLQ